ncbi:enoyl-CoA hydratase-related protein [Gammaproteobacteria bacterium]|nr:enoyl-CoA hydratase-related protein [Gammaproteobacteria bacterium]
MDSTCFNLTIENNIAQLTLNRPEKRNSMIPEFWDELPQIIRRIDQESLARVIVISSTGPHFTSGIDISVFESSKKETVDHEKQQELNRVAGAKLYDTVQYLQQTFSCLEESRIPILVAIQGGAIGGGVDLITACDMRYMTEDAFLSIFEINIGMTADVGTFPRICKLLPEGVVKELAYTGRKMSATEAKALGLVNEIYKDHEAMLLGVMKIAQKIARKAPLAIYGSKRIINYARDHSTADTLDYIGIWNASMLQQDEIREAMTAPKEDRDPNFVELPQKRTKMSSGLTDQ